MNNLPITVEQVYNAPVETVWRAISDRDSMKDWYFELKEFRPQPGFAFQFYGGSHEKQFLHLCKVVDANPNTKLSYTWKYEGYPGESLVTFELFSEGDNTRLRLTHSGLETFPSNIPDFAKENFVGGWNEIIGKNLKDYVERNAK